MFRSISNDTISHIRFPTSQSNPIPNNSSNPEASTNFSEKARSTKKNTGKAEKNRKSWELSEGKWWLDDPNIPVFIQRKFSATVNSACYTIRNQAHALGISQCRQNILEKTVTDMKGKSGENYGLLNEIENLKKEKDRYKKIATDCDRYKNERDEYKRDYQKMKKKNEILNKTIKNYNEYADNKLELINENKKLQIEIEKVDNNYKKVEAKNNKLELDNEKLEFENRDLFRENRDLKGKNSQLNKRHGKVLDELKYYKKWHNDSNSKSNFYTENTNPKKTDIDDNRTLIDANPKNAGYANVVDMIGSESREGVSIPGSSKRASSEASSRIGKRQKIDPPKLTQSDSKTSLDSYADSNYNSKSRSRTDRFKPERPVDMSWLQKYNKNI